MQSTFLSYDKEITDDVVAYYKKNLDELDLIINLEHNRFRKQIKARLEKED